MDPLSLIVIGTYALLITMTLVFGVVVVAAYRQEAARRRAAEEDVREGRPKL